MDHSSVCYTPAAERVRKPNHSASENLLYNWCGINPLASYRQIQCPRSEAELVDLIANSTGKIRTVGSGLSYEPLAAVVGPDDLLIDMKHFTGLRRISKHAAVFGAAERIDDVIAVLREHGRMLPCSPGVIGIQTLAGSIATGTHGQGLYQSSYADVVISLRVVLPSGEVAIVGGEHGRKDLPLAAFVTSLGMLGVITEIEIKIAPIRVFACRKLTCHLDAFMQNYRTWNEDVEYVKVWWFPDSDLCHVWFTDSLSPSSSSCKSFLTSPRTEPIESDISSSLLNKTVDQYCEALSADTRSSVGPQFRTLRRFADARDLVGFQEQILCKGIPAPQINCEIAVPLNQFVAATAALREWSARNEGRLHYPFIYRATGRSKAWLNPAYRGPMVYIGFLVYIAADGAVRDDGLDTMRELQDLLAEFGGLPHWGKHFVPALYDFPTEYVKWKDFVKLRNRLDPHKRFINPFLRGLFDGGAICSTISSRLCITHL